MKALFTYRVCFFFGVILLLNNVTIGQQLPIFSQYLLNDYAYNPAVAGSKVDPFIPGPENVPPDGVPVRLNAPSTEHTSGYGEVAETVGRAFTVIVCE